jgi:hypothetical protein
MIRERTVAGRLVRVAAGMGLALVHCQLFAPSDACSDVSCLPGMVCRSGICFDVDRGCLSGGCTQFGQVCSFIDSGTAAGYGCTDCESDLDCLTSAGPLPPGSQQCVRGRCVLGLVSCASDSTCLFSRCIAGTCIQCTSDDGCGSPGSSLNDRSRCIDGQCVVAGVCLDGTQCGNSERCVDGACVPSCDAAATCPTGYACDALGTCSGNPRTCGAGTPPCDAGLACVEAHCVPTCSSRADCGNGLVCVGGGCIPDQFPKVTCLTEGRLGDGSLGECAAGLLCVNHACYVPCDADAGACSDAGAAAVCKRVGPANHDYLVCGSNTNLGSECNPPLRQWCNAPHVCVDGFCL